MAIAIESANDRATIPKMETIVERRKAIGARVKAARTERGLTQVQLAEAAGIDQSTVSDVERGKTFGAEILMALAVTLMKSPQFLMTGQDDPYNLSAQEALVLQALRQAKPPPPPEPKKPEPIPSESITARQVSNTPVKRGRKVV